MPLRRGQKGTVVEVDADYLTPFEKELVLKTTILSIFSNLMWGLMNTALNTKLMAIANNDPTADYPAACLGMGATIHTNKRAIPADDFFTDLFETALEEGEIVTKVTFPAPRRRPT